MKNILVVLIIIGGFSLAKAQVNAITETGEEVVLFENGTWKFLNPEQNKSTIVETNPTHFFKSEASTFLLKSKKVNVGIYLNPKKWSFNKAENNPDAEYELQMKNSDLYAVVITERMNMPLQSLREVAVSNAKSVAPDIRIVKEEYRIVNGIKVLLLVMYGTMQGMEFFYYSYYFSSNNGVVQLITYSGQNLFNEYKNDCEEFLNGFVQFEE